jgi:hypothetical protein
MRVRLRVSRMLKQAIGDGEAGIPIWYAPDDHDLDALHKVTLHPQYHVICSHRQTLGEIGIPASFLRRNPPTCSQTRQEHAHAQFPTHDVNDCAMDAIAARRAATNSHYPR